MFSPVNVYGCPPSVSVVPERVTNPDGGAATVGEGVGFGVADGADVGADVGFGGVEVDTGVGLGGLGVGAAVAVGATTPVERAVALGEGTAAIVGAPVGAVVGAGVGEGDADVASWTEKTALPVPPADFAPGPRPFLSVEIVVAAGAALTA